MVAALALGVVAPVTAHAGDAVPVVLLPASGVNVSPTILDAARDLLKDHLQRTGRYTVITGPGAPTSEEPTASIALEQAQAAHAQQAIVLRLIHLGASTRVRFTVYGLTGEVLYWDSMAITGGPGDMDVVLQRLVRALVLGKPVRDSAELETVTNDEMDTLKRRTANKVFGLHVFTLLPFNTPDDKFKAVPGIGLFWMYDARSWMADIAVDIGGTGNRELFDVSLGGYYPFLREDFTPYVGGKVRYGYFSFGGAGSAGLALEPTFGVLLGRTSSVQLRAEVGYFVSAFAEDVQVPVNYQSITQLTSTGENRVSHGPSLTVGLGF
jgi:hypothetical protein